MAPLSMNLSSSFYGHPSQEVPNTNYSIPSTIHKNPPPVPLGTAGAWIKGGKIQMGDINNVRLGPISFLSE